jgi:hypothetical protein
VWGFLFDEVHHRGQLSTYLRPMGGKVPSIHGPSADDPGRWERPAKPVGSPPAGHARVEASRGSSMTHPRREKR